MISLSVMFLFTLPFSYLWVVFRYFVISLVLFVM